MKAGGERDGNCGEVALAEGAEDGPAVLGGHGDDGTVVGDENAPPPASVVGPDGPPAWIVEQRIADDPSDLVVPGGLDLPDVVMNWRRQGDLGELSAMEWFASKGALVAVPLGHSPDYDLIADLGDRLARVQVKTCTAHRFDRWQVTICTRGGNQSWSGLVKHFDPASCDFLFVVVGDGRRWCIPSTALRVRRGIALGGRKYSEFEVEPGAPLPPRDAGAAASTIVSLDPRGDVRVAKGARL